MNTVLERPDDPFSMRHTCQRPTCRSSYLRQDCADVPGQRPVRRGEIHPGKVFYSLQREFWRDVYLLVQLSF